MKRQVIAIAVAFFVLTAVSIGLLVSDYRQVQAASDALGSRPTESDWVALDSVVGKYGDLPHAVIGTVSFMWREAALIMVCGVAYLLVIRRSKTT